MKQRKHLLLWITFPRFALLNGVALIVLVFLWTACSFNTATMSVPTSVNRLTLEESTSSTAKSYPIKVYFSKFPESEKNSSAVFPVGRVSPTQYIGTFAIQLLLAGPTPEERSTGYLSELNSILSGSSNCSAPFPTGGPDFMLKLNVKGTVTEQGTATVHFCRETRSPGVGTDARVIAEITATLKQFSTIKKVVILTKEGHCFGDESGQDRCLN